MGLEWAGALLLPKASALPRARQTLPEPALTLPATMRSSLMPAFQVVCLRPWRIFGPTLGLLCAVPLLVACEPPPASKPPVTPEFTVSLSTSALIPTVVVVDWALDLEEMKSARIEYGPDTAYGHTLSSRIEAGPPYRDLLLGTPADSELHLRVIAEGPLGEYASEDQVVSTGSLPASLPNLSVEHGVTHWEGFLLTSLLASSAGPVILDDQGNYVWWYPIDKEKTWEGTVPGRSQIARDGRSLYFSYNNVSGGKDNAIFEVSLDGAAIERIDAPYAHHDFLELPDGGLAWIAYDPREVKGEEILGDRLMERSPEGVTREVFSIWDHYEYTPGDTPRGAAWPHANALDYIPEQDIYILGFLALGAIMGVDRSSGEILWTLGGPESDWTLDGKTELFEAQHQFQLLDDSMLVFVNGAVKPGARSRAEEFTLPLGSTALERRWSYWPDPTLNCTWLGDVHRFDTGSTLVTFSAAGQIHEVSPEGELLWKLSAEIGGALSYSSYLPDLDLGAW